MLWDRTKQLPKEVFKQVSSSVQSGVNIMIAIFGDFRQFSAIFAKRRFFESQCYV
jgi:hypothetical protein